MTHHYPDLNSDFDGLKHIFSQLLRNKNQIWVLKCHQYEIYVLMACFLIAWVSGVSGERGKDGSEKGRELKERNPSPPSPLLHQKSPLPYPVRKACYSGYVLHKTQTHSTHALDFGAPRWIAVATGNIHIKTSQEQK